MLWTEKGISCRSDWQRASIDHNMDVFRYISVIISSNVFRYHSVDHSKKVKEQIVDLVLGKVSMKYIWERCSELIAMDFCIWIVTYTQVTLVFRSIRWHAGIWRNRERQPLDTDGVIPPHRVLGFNRCWTWGRTFLQYNLSSLQFLRLQTIMVQTWKKPRVQNQNFWCWCPYNGGIDSLPL